MCRRLLMCRPRSFLLPSSQAAETVVMTAASSTPYARFTFFSPDPDCQCLVGDWLRKQGVVCLAHDTSTTDFGFDVEPQCCIAGHTCPALQHSCSMSKPKSVVGIYHVCEGDYAGKPWFFLEKDENYQLWWSPEEGDKWIVGWPSPDPTTVIAECKSHPLNDMVPWVAVPCRSSLRRASQAVNRGLN